MAKTSIESDLALSIATAANELKAAYSMYWPRSDEADPSERHLSFSLAAALKSRGYTPYFEVPFDRGYLDLVAVNWKARREICVEFKNLYAGGKQARSMARDVQRLRRWEGVDSEHQTVERRRLALGSTWQRRTREEWLTNTTKRFADVRRALGPVVASRGSVAASRIEGGAWPQQWLLWLRW